MTPQPVDLDVEAFLRRIAADALALADRLQGVEAGHRLAEAARRYVGVKEAARLARISARTVRRIAARHPEIRVQRQGHPRIDLDALARAIEAE